MLKETIKCTSCSIFQDVLNFRIKVVKNKEYVSHKCKSCEQQLQKENTSNSWPRYFTRLLSKRQRRLTLSVDDCLELLNKQKGMCAVTGVPLTKVHGKGVVNTNASLDRIAAGGSYTKDNVRIVCSIVNKMRLDNSDDEFLWWCEKVLNGINARSN